MCMLTIDQYLLLSGCYTGAELLEIQRQVDCLSDPSSPESVGRLLQLRRQVLLLQFDTAVRHLIRSVPHYRHSCNRHLLLFYICVQWRSCALAAGSCLPLAVLLVAF